MPKLTKGQITKANKKYGGRFSPKYRAFQILKNQIEDVKNSTLIWKVLCRLKTIKEGEEDPFEGKDDEEEVEKEQNEEKQEEGEKEKEEETMEKTQQGEEETTKE